MTADELPGAAVSRRLLAETNGSGRLHDESPGDGNPGAALLDDVTAFLARFVAYPSEHARVAHTLWITHTHLMDAWESTPRIAFLSPEPGSGKTRAGVEVPELLVPNPIEAVNVTPAYLFRKIGQCAPTILYDEIDTVFGPKAKDNEEIRGLLNAGHRRGAVAGRCVVRGKIVETEEIPAYCAVALIGLGGLPDTLLSRSVVIRMRRRAQHEHVEDFRRRQHAPEGHALRDRLAEWSDAIRDSVTAVWPDMPGEIRDRDADVWEALLACADAAGGHWPKAARQAAVALVAESKRSTPSLGVQLLADLRLVFGEAEALSTEAILQALHKLDESPWGDLRGKPLDARGLARRLRDYEIRSTKVWVDGHSLQGYRREDLHDAWQRYLRLPIRTEGPEGPEGKGAPPSTPSGPSASTGTLSHGQEGRRLPSTESPSQPYLLQSLAPQDAGRETDDHETDAVTEAAVQLLHTELGAAVVDTQDGDQPEPDQLSEPGPPTEVGTLPW
ncbi:MAG: DUF3631 domain-containing protein [Pseudonocardiaceae bacterium]